MGYVTHVAASADGPVPAPGGMEAPRLMTGSPSAAVGGAVIAAGSTSSMREPEMPVIKSSPALKRNVIPTPVHGDRQTIAETDQEIDVCQAP